MKLLNNKIILKEVKEENQWGHADKDALKRGLIAFPFKGKIEDEMIEFKKSDEVFYQYGKDIKLDGVDYILVNASNLICQK